MHNVNLSYSSEVETVAALDNVTLEVESGQFVTVFGASGSGKTTLLNVAAGLSQPDSGTVVVAEQVMTGASEADRAETRLRHVGVVFQDHNLIPEFSARENVQLPLVSQGLPRNRAAGTARDLLEEVGIGELGERMPAQLSGGQKQRVGIARAVAGGREVLLADEPTGALDSTNSRAVFALLRKLAGEGVAVMVASHDPLAREFSDRIVTMVDGAIRSDELASATIR
jgi:putative ABC transport system ATP-binding protein